jgi:hypothetical protein
MGGGDRNKFFININLKIIYSSLPIPHVPVIMITYYNDRLVIYILNNLCITFF